MAYKFLTRLGFLTGILFYTTHIGVWAEPDMDYELTEPMSKRLRNTSDSSGKNFENMAYFPVHNCCFGSQQNFNNAIQRGFYFAYRLPDWTSEFVRHTEEILQENMLKTYTKDIHRLEQNNSWLTTEGNTFQHRIDNHEIYTPVNMNDTRPMKLPKIKDDITCGKRVFA